MPKDERGLEKKLIGTEDIDLLIARSIEEKISREREQARISRKVCRTTTAEFSEVPPGRVFSPDTVFLVYNRKNATESFINGVQAEGLVGLNHDIREALNEGRISSFSSGDYYVKFSSYSCRKPEK